MICIELKPNLSSCIETLSKREYERTLKLFFEERGRDEEELLEKLEVLRLFLESTNFSHLRGQYEGYLTEGKEVTFQIYSEEGNPSYKMIVE